MTADVSTSYDVNGNDDDECVRCSRPTGASVFVILQKRVLHSFCFVFFFLIKSNTSAGDVDAVDVLSTSVLIYVSIVVMIDTMAKTINSTVMVRIMVIVSAH